MTLGNNQQPLTRRQARELARQVQQEIPAEDTNPVSDPVAAVPAPATDDQGANASGGPAAEDVDDSDSAYTTLSRRELRSLIAAKAAETQASMGGQDDFASSSAVYDDREDDGIDDAVESDAVEMVEVEPDPAPVEPVQKLNPPVGHWSVARDVDDEVTSTGSHQPLDQLTGRGVSSGGMPTTTNALILPSIPQPGTGQNPLTSTGEVLITGSIDLPRSLGSTGQLPNTFDSSEMDHMLDQLDDSEPTSSVAPVSASKAVSSHASTRGVMTPPKSHAISVPTVLSITGAVLGVGVLGLFLGGTVFHIF